MAKRRTLRTLAVLIAGFPVLMLFLWLWSMLDLARDQSRCSFGAVSEAEFQQLINRASAQSWTVWPELSNGLIAPSDRGIRPQTTNYRIAGAERLRAHIRELASDGATGDQLLAAAHALMRSIGAEYVFFVNLPSQYESKKVVSSRATFTYVMASRRFAPLCLPCFVWPSTNINISFRQDLITNTVAFEGITINHQDLLSSPAKTRAPDFRCPRLAAS